MKSKRAIICCLILLAVVFLTNRVTLARAVSGDAAKPNACGNTDFALKLFQQVSKDKTDNVVISPFSAYAALSMTLNGAAGSTREQMAKMLGVTADDLDSLNRRNQSTMSSMIREDEKCRLELANAVFADSRTPFKQSFIDVCQKLYGAEALSMPFSDPNTVTKINSWCDSKTHGKIPKILDKLTASEIMVILNAVYFKGAWERPFEKADTSNDSFIGLSGKTQPVKMMHQQENMLYFKGANFRAISMPYYGGHQSMYIFLPDQQTSLSLVQAELTSQKWTEWMQSFTEAHVNLFLPKFKVEYSKLLNSDLQALGMTKAFQRDADFSNLTPMECRISRVLQKTFIDVNEEGTEAAAVTAVVAEALCARQLPPRVDFRVDHPFMLALVDNDTKEILFLGSIVSPSP